jgi:putative transposase
MDGRGQWMDKVFIKRLWRSIKYEDIYLREYRNVAELAAGVRSWMQRYNTWRPHQAFANRTPMEVYRPKAKRQNTSKEAKVAA